MTIETDRIRRLFPATDGQDHHKNCHYDHERCAIHKLCDDIDHLARLAESALNGVHNRPDDLVDSDSRRIYNSAIESLEEAAEYND